MQKFTLLAAAALVAGAANAQYTCDPSASVVLGKGKVSYVGAIVLDTKTADKFKEQGATVEEYGSDDQTRHLWYWEDTFTTGTTPIFGVDDHQDGYVSLVVGSKGWSGAGFAVDAPGINTSMWNDNTRFHLAYYSPATVCPSVAVIIADGKAKGEDGKVVVSAPAKVALGAAFVDNGATFPAIAPACNDDWQGIDLSFSDLKKLWPAFDYKANAAWEGNIMSLLAGGVQGQTIAVDAVYFYNLGNGGGVEGVADDATNWVVTPNTVNLNGANGIALYNLAGQLVKSTEGCVLGLDNLAAGVYVARSAKSSVKVGVK